MTPSSVVPDSEEGEEQGGGFMNSSDDELALQPAPSAAGKRKAGEFLLPRLKHAKIDSLASRKIESTGETQGNT